VESEDTSEIAAWKAADQPAGGRRYLARRSQIRTVMSKNNNVNPNFYKVGGREHSEGADKGDTRADQKQKLSKNKKQVLPGHKDEKK
jgi:hypothetical protein